MHLFLLLMCLAWEKMQENETKNKTSYLAWDKMQENKKKSGWLEKILELQNHTESK